MRKVGQTGILMLILTPVFEKKNFEFIPVLLLLKNGIVLHSEKEEIAYYTSWKMNIWMKLFGFIFIKEHLTLSVSTISVSYEVKLYNTWGKSILWRGKLVNIMKTWKSGLAIL